MKVRLGSSVHRNEERKSLFPKPLEVVRTPSAVDTLLYIVNVAIYSECRTRDVALYIACHQGEGPL